jgi:hypothetical protein
VHVDAIRAAVELRRARLDELDQAGLQAGLADVGFQWRIAM